MGRVKAKFPTGNIVIKNRKPNKEGKVALYFVKTKSLFVYT